MYNNVYQEYINNMLGTIPKVQSDFEFDTYRNANFFQNQNTTNSELERFYPDLYKLLYPMIQTACMRNTKPITEETINEMVNDIYSNFNADDVTILNINLTNDVRSSKTNESSKTSNIKTTSKVSSEVRNKLDVEERNIKPNNYVLNDLIRILLIRELLGRSGNNFPSFRQEFPSSRSGFGKPSHMNYGQQAFGIYEEPHMYYNFDQGYNLL